MDIIDQNMYLDPKTHEITNQQLYYRVMAARPVKARGLLKRVNDIDIKKACIKCGGNKIIDLDWQKAPYDWQCSECGTYQLTYIKSKGFRLFAFLLDGSWTSKNFYARSLKEAYKLASHQYGVGKNGVVGSYLVGKVDGFVLDGWFSMS